jgi:diacylglycerol kinase
LAHPLRIIIMEPAEVRRPTAMSNPSDPDRRSLGHPSNEARYEPHAGLGSVGRFLIGFVDAGRGLGLLLGQRNARVHLAVTVAVAGLGALLRIQPWEWIAVTLAAGMVWSAEALNTAIERLADRVSPERSEVVRDVKDLAAGGVLATAIAAAIVGLIVFVPALVSLAGR